MSRISMIVVAVCGLLAGPALGYWEYDGTNAWPAGPGYDYDPYGTWAWWQTASGTYSGGPWHLATWASAIGGSEVHLTPDRGLSRFAWAESGASAMNSYHWVEDETDDKEVFLEVYVTIDSAGVDYWGSALNRTCTCEAVASSVALGEGRADLALRYYFYPRGVCIGEANSEGGSFAINSLQGVDAWLDYADAGSWQTPLHGYYEGMLRFSCVAEDTYEGTPWGTSFTVLSSVMGSCTTQGELVLTDPSGWGGFDAFAEYGITGTSEIYLSGNIQ